MQKSLTYLGSAPGGVWRSERGLQRLSEPASRGFSLAFFRGHTRASTSIENWPLLRGKHAGQEDGAPLGKRTPPCLLAIHSASCLPRYR